MEKQDLLDAVKAIPTAALTGAWWLNISVGQVVAVLGGAYTVLVAVEKFYKVALWLGRKFKKSPRPPEG